MKAWLFHSKHTGDLNSRKGVAEALVGSNYEMLELDEDIHKDAEKLKAWLKQKMGTQQLSAATQWPDIIISNTKKEAKVAQRIKTASHRDIFLLHLNRPVKDQIEKFDTTGFDLVVDYHHHDSDDKQRGNNTRIYDGLPHRINERTLETGKKEWEDKFSFLKNKKPVFFLIVGGNIGSRIEFTPNYAEKMGKEIRDTVKHAGGSLVITNSPRTPREATQALMAQISGIPCYFHDWQRDAGDGNPYIGLLAMADKIIVTGDSMSMCCEAAATGKPVYIYTAPGQLEATHEKLVNRLVERNAAKFFTGEDELWQPSPINMTQKIAQDVHEIMERKKQRQASR